MLLDSRDLASGSLPPVLSLGALAPARVADLMLALAFGGTVSSVVLRAGDGIYHLSCMRGGVTTRTFGVAEDVGIAASARLAASAGLDPLVESNTPEGTANSARVKVRAGDEVGELLISVGASAGGIEVEVHALTVNGARPVRSSRTTLQRCTTCDTFEPAHREVCSHAGGKLVDVDERAAPGGFVGMYRVGVELGAGGMGAVFEGTHVLLGREVAIKVMSRAVKEDSLVYRKFLQEARAASRLRHQNIVEVTDFGMLRDGSPYIVMEKIDGVSLYEQLERAVETAAAPRSLPPVVALRIAREIAVALAAAHDGGVVHNDLKPLNVMMLKTSTDDVPRLKLVDFGAASLLDALRENADEIFGTPRYMSPEHIRGLPTDARSDLYSLGLILYELLSGDAPFPSETIHQAFMSHTQLVPALVTSPHGSLPQGVTHLVSRALNKNPAERHQSAAEMAVDLERALAVLERPVWRRWLP